MKTKFRGFIQYVTTARSLTGRPRLASPGGSSRTSLIVAMGRRLSPSRDPAPAFPVPSEGDASTGRTMASSSATFSPVRTTKPSRSTRASGRAISSILTRMLPVPSSIDEVPPGCWVIVPCTRTRCLEAVAGDARSRLSTDCTGTENGSDAAASSTWMSLGAGDQDLQPDRLTARIERRIGDASNSDPGIDQGLPDGRSRAEDARLEHAIGIGDVQGKPSIVLDSRGVHDAHGLDVSIRERG